MRVITNQSGKNRCNYTGGNRMIKQYTANHVAQRSVIDCIAGQRAQCISDKY